MNNKDRAIESLMALAENINEKSDVAKLREVFGYVEMALSSGVSREKVLETIRTTLGIKMNLKTFENNLYRIRKKQKSGKLAEMPKTNEEINSGSQQFEVRSDITAPAVTSNMQVDLATKQPISGELIENDQNHDNNANSWKDRMIGAEIYNTLHALGHAHSKEQKRIEKEKKYEQARLKRLGKI